MDTIGAQSPPTDDEGLSSEMVRQIAQSTSAESDETTDNKFGMKSKCKPSNHNETSQKTDSVSASKDHYFQEIFGFPRHDLTSWERLVKLLCRPSDPSGLGILRFMFGFLMIQDTIQERGFGDADILWGDVDECRFPLFNFLRPLPVEWMYIVYIIMLTGACGIMLGLKMKLSSALFLGSYWYILFLNKATWNNHSYLFGILAFLFAISDANRFWSIDGLLDPKIKNAHVPLWNYTLLRAQIFILYFYAGLKKLDMDWMFGYSMQSLASHWIFDPFKILLTEPQIDLYIVHLGGLFIDISLGFLLFLDKTRMFGLLLSSSFHLMNSIIFRIGMFPYAMLVTQLVFCDMNWPRQFINAIPCRLRLFNPEDTDFQPSSHCIYTKENIKSETLNPKFKTAYSIKPPATTSTWWHNLTSLFTLMFIAWQLFLPYSHGITKGYNNWTNGLYGYSWDMMVHSWTVQHIRITYYDKDTGQSGYLKPNIWINGGSRWSSHTDMIQQYAHCLADNLRSYNITNIAIYFDIWRSLNYRFQQRGIDPRVDIITAEWSPLTDTPWMMPLMVDLSDWRTKLNEIETSLNNDAHTSVVFIADFPGMSLENYVHPDFGNTTITVLAGKVMVELVDKSKNITLGPDQSLQVTADSFHNVHTISETASCYMYVFVNTTEATLMKGYNQFEADYNKTASLNETLHKYKGDPNRLQYHKILTDKLAETTELETAVWNWLENFFKSKYNMFKRSIQLSTGAIYCLATNSSFDDFLDATYNLEGRNETALTMK